MPATTILRLARTIRWAIVCSLTRNARAIWSVVRPTTARRVRATRASTARAGWQQPNSSGNRSSGASACPTRGTAVGAQPVERLLVTLPAAEPVQGVASRRDLQPGAGLVGDAVGAPVPERLDDGVLHRLLGDVEVADLAVQGRHDRPGLGPDRRREGRVRAGDGWWGSAHMSPSVVDDRPDLYGDAGELQRRPGPGHRQRRVEVRDVDDGEAADDLLGLGERPVDDDRGRRRCSSPSSRW